MLSLRPLPYESYDMPQVGFPLHFWDHGEACECALNAELPNFSAFSLEIISAFFLWTSCVGGPSPCVLIYLVHE